MATSVCNLRIGTAPGGLAKLKQYGSIAEGAAHVLDSGKHPFAMDGAEFAGRQVGAKERLFAGIDKIPKCINVDGDDLARRVSLRRQIAAKSCRPGRVRIQ